MSNNKNKLRTELTNLYGGTNKFLTNAEITTLVNKSSGSNHLNIKKQAYKQAYSKYYNHVFGNVFNKMLQIVKSEMKPSPQCPTGVNSESVIKAAERSVEKRFGRGTTQGVKAGMVVGGVIGGATGKGVDAIFGAGKKIAQFCKGNPTNPRCKNNFGSNSESNNETPNTNPKNKINRMHYLTNENKKGFKNRLNGGEAPQSVLKAAGAIRQLRN
jgi:hypothetical protein